MFIRISKMWLFNSVPMSFDYSRIWGRIPFHNYGSLKWCHSFYIHWDEGLFKKKTPLYWLLPATGAWQRFGNGGTWVVSATRVLTIPDLERFSKHTDKTGDLRLLLLRENKNLHLLTSGRILPTEGTSNAVNPGNSPCGTFLSSLLFCISALGSFRAESVFSRSGWLSNWLGQLPRSWLLKSLCWFYTEPRQDP